ncbi:MAG: methyltransferase domain-containing protein [Alphaproteobacteria bacterium]
MTANTAPYATQARGKESDYDRYFSGMDKTMQQKLAVTAAHFLLRPGAVIADMGCGSGLGSFQFAQLNPSVKVVGIDINPEVVRHGRETYKLPNLSFEEGDVEKPDARLGRFDGILNSSVLHHVLSFNDYDPSRVVNALRNQMAALNEGGIMVIRDFSALPDNEFVLLDVRAGASGVAANEASDADLLVQFSETARALREPRDRGFFMEEVAGLRDGFRRFRLSAKWANEFILRKDYRHSWDVEVLEEYSWWTPEDYRRELATLGGRVLHTAPFWNPWILENRYKGKVFLHDENGKERGYPPTQFIAVVEKVPDGASILLAERAIAKAPKNFLKVTSWKNTKTGRVYDMASRPGTVADCLPYFTGADGRLMIFAKHGYPRPLVGSTARGTVNLDDKHWSGHVVEPIAIVENGEPLLPQLAAYAGLDAAQLGAAEPCMKYYPSPGMMDEIVSSCFFPVAGAEGRHSKRLPVELAGLSDSGEIRLYPAQDLLRAAQVGMLPEARLELNIYALLRHLGLRPDKWLGTEVMPPPAGRVETRKLSDLLAAPKVSVWKKQPEPAGYLHYIRSAFADRSRTTELARREIEFVLPAKASANVISVAPLAMNDKGEICIGLERRDLPAPQAYEGNSSIYVLPAWRLPYDVTTEDEAAAFAVEKLGGARAMKLGASYYPSLGVTPERVYPFALHCAAATLKEPLVYVTLRDLFDNLENLRDAHLIIAALRAIHALGLWP